MNNMRLLKDNEDKYWAIKHPKHGLLPCTLRKDKMDTLDSYLEFRVDLGSSDEPWVVLERRGYTLVFVTVTEVLTKRVKEIA